MASLNRTDRLTLDAFSDPNLAGPVYNKFTNTLKAPLLGVKGVQLVNLDTINSSLQLNDDNGQLMFFYYASPVANPRVGIDNLYCVRLVPSWYVPPTDYTAFTRNAYFNSGTELAAALTAAASTGGDDYTYNQYWLVGQVTFSYDTATRRMSFVSTNTTRVAPAAADDPLVLDLLRGTTYPNQRIKMNQVNNVSGYAGGLLQPYREGITMNARLGWPLKVDQRGPFWSSSSFYGLAWSAGIGRRAADGPIPADTPPILLGVQNIGVYLSIVTGGGTDSKGRKNLIGTVPMESAPYAVQSYTMCSVEVPSLSTANEIYEVTVELICPETGAPYNVWSSANTSVGLTLTY